MRSSGSRSRARPRTAADDPARRLATVARQRHRRGELLVPFAGGEVGDDGHLRSDRDIRERSRDRAARGRSFDDARRTPVDRDRRVDVEAVHRPVPGALADGTDGKGPEHDEIHHRHSRSEIRARVRGRRPLEQQHGRDEREREREPQQRLVGDEHPPALDPAGDRRPQREQRTRRVVGRGARVVYEMQVDTVGQPGRAPPTERVGTRARRGTPSARTRAGRPRTSRRAAGREPRARVTTRRARAPARPHSGVGRGSVRSWSRPARSAAAARVRIICDGQKPGASAGAARCATGSGRSRPRTPCCSSARSHAPQGRPRSKGCATTRSVRTTVASGSQSVAPAARRRCPQPLGEQLALAGRVAVVVRRRGAAGDPADVGAQLPGCSARTGFDRECAGGDDDDGVGGHGAGRLPDCELDRRRDVHGNGHGSERVEERSVSGGHDDGRTGPRREDDAGARDLVRLRSEADDRRERRIGMQGRCRRPKGRRSRPGERVDHHRRGAADEREHDDHAAGHVSGPDPRDGGADERDASSARPGARSCGRLPAS